MPILFYVDRYLKNRNLQWIIFLLSIVFSSSLSAATYNLTSGSYPPCNTSWSVSGTTYTCTGATGRVTLGSSDILTSNTTITISANNGFVFANNTIGSLTNRINLVASNGSIQSGITNTIFGNITATTSNITLINTTVNGTITTGGAINLTGGSVSGKVTSSGSNLVTSSTNLSNGAQTQTSMSITGGTIAGSFVLTSSSATFTTVNMTSGSISNASTVLIRTSSTMGSSGSPITVNTIVGAITVNSSVVYGNLTAPDNSTVNVTNGATVNGVCLPGSTPVNACSINPLTPVTMSCSAGTASGITGNYYNNTSLTSPVVASRSDGPINFNWDLSAPGPSGINSDYFSVRWSGYIRVTQTGAYRFQTDSDDGVRLYLNGNVVLERWDVHPETTDSTTDIYLVAGKTYTITLEFYDEAWEAVIRLRWLLPGSGTYVAIPSGPLPTLGAGLYECVTTPASYQITHNATGITCAAEAVTVSARNAVGVVYNPPAGTVVTLSTAPATGAWVGGNTFTFTGSESSFTKYLRQTTAGSLTIQAASATASSTSPITFVDTVLRIVQDSALANIPTQVAGVNGSAIAKVISTNPETGVCEAIVASRTLQTGLGFTCNNPTTCVGGQTFTVNGSSIAANNNAASVTYNNVNLTFDANGEAPMTIHYSDVGQVTLHGRLTIDAVGNNPELTLSTSSNAFVVKPHTLIVSSITSLSDVVTPQSTNSGAGFIPAGEQFKVFVQARNANGAATPNFGNETTSEKDAISLTASSLVHPTGGVLTALTNSGSFATATPAGTFVNSGIQWNQAGSIRIMPSLTDNDYLSAGNIANLSDGNLVAGRFYPNHFALLNPVLTNASCGTFSYMQQPLNLSYSIEARGTANTKLTNYIPAYGTMPTIAYVTENADSGINLQRFVDGATYTWNAGELSINSTTARFNRLITNQAPDGPFESLQVGLQLTDSFDSRSMQGMDMNASSTEACIGLACTAIKLGSPIDMRYGRLRLDDAFGPETASLPVNFATEFWTGSFFTPNTNDSCTKILRSAITYPAGNILTPANLTLSLTGGNTTGTYGQMTVTEVEFVSGSATHAFSAPTGGGTGSFSVAVDLTSYPWLRYDWNQDGTFSDLTLPTARYTFGSYRGHDRVIYWRERF